MSTESANYPMPTGPKRPSPLRTAYPDQQPRLAYPPATPVRKLMNRPIADNTTTDIDEMLGYLD